MAVQSKYFSRTLSFLVNSVSSALASRYVLAVEGQKDEPFNSSDVSPGIMCRLDRLMILTCS